MKVTPNTKQVLTGSIAPAELAAFLRQTFEIPEGATVAFHDGEVTDEHPLKFAAEWTGTQQAEQVVSARVVANVKLP